MTRSSRGGTWVEALGRVGFAAKGIVYGLVGVLAVRMGMGGGGAAGGQKDALVRIGSAPLGNVLLVAIGVGLFGYAAYRAVQAILNPDRVGSDAKGIAKRIAYGVSAVLHTGLGVSALRLVGGHRGRSGEASTDGWTAKLMQQPFGRWLVALVGAAILVVAVSQFVRAYRATFMRRTKQEEMAPNTRRWLERLGRAGHAARGVVFTITGMFMLVAAYRVSPGEARGLGGALSMLARQPYGPLLLIVVALGLAAYGAYALALARYRRIQV